MREVVAAGLIPRQGSVFNMERRKIIQRRAPKHWLEIVCAVLEHDLRYFKSQLKIVNHSGRGKRLKRVSNRLRNRLRVRGNDSALVGSHINKHNF